MTDPAKTALIVIDVQEGILPDAQGERADASKAALDSMVARLADLQARARAAGLMLVHVQHDAPDDHRLAKGTPGWEIRREIAPQPGDLVIHKHVCDSFHETGLEQALRDAGITRVIIGGCMTPFCIDTSVRSAVGRGFEVVLLSDGHTTCDMGGLSFEQIIAHHNFVLGYFDAKSSLATIAEVI